MLGVDFFQVLPTGRPDLPEVLRSLEFTVMGIKHRFGGDVFRSRLRHFRAVHLREGLSFADMGTELCRDGDDTSTYERRNRYQLVRIWLYHPWQATNGRTPPAWHLGGVGPRSA